MTTRYPGSLADALRAAFDLVLPAVCAGCGKPGHGLCARCLRALAALRRAGPAPVTTADVRAGLPPVWAAGAYEGELRHLIVAYKDGDRRDLRTQLAPLLAASLARSLRARPPAAAPLVVAVPTSPASRRRRGDDPLGDLTEAAVGLLVPRPNHRQVLAVTRRVADQSGLDARRRAANLAGAFTTRARLPGTACVLVDDVVTTGSTLSEAARALRAAGADPVACAVLAATPRRGCRRT